MVCNWLTPSLSKAIRWTIKGRVESLRGVIELNSTYKVAFASGYTVLNPFTGNLFVLLFNTQHRAQYRQKECIH